MIEIVGLLGLVAFVVASLAVGGRVFLLALRTRQLPEMAIALTLILAGGIGTALVVVPLLIPDLKIGTAYFFYQAGSASNHAGFALLFLFVWRVFRPRETWAIGLYVISTGVLLVGGIGTAVDLVPGGGVPGRTIPPDLWFWMSLNARIVVYSWATFESFHYYVMLKRRSALGLADPLIADRFFYWGVSTGAVVCIWLNLAIRAVMMDSVWIRSISDVVSSALGFVVAGSLYFAFFPSKKRVSDRDSSSAEEAAS